jgi:hypothetical protein
LTLEETANYMTAPTTNGDKPLPRRVPKGLLPSTWLERELRVEHTVGGAVRETVGTLADLYPAGPILIVDGRRTLLTWDTLATVELVPD